MRLSGIALSEDSTASRLESFRGTSVDTPRFYTPSRSFEPAVKQGRPDVAVREMRYNDRQAEERGKSNGLSVIPRSEACRAETYAR